MLTPEIIEKNAKLNNVIQPVNSVLAKIIHQGVPISQDIIFFLRQKHGRIVLSVSKSD